MMNKPLMGKFIQEKGLDEIYFVFDYYKDVIDKLIRSATIRADKVIEGDVIVSLPVTTMKSSGFKKWYQIAPYSDKLTHNVIKCVLNGVDIWMKNEVI